MKPNRLEAFSDGVLAIVITIMVLEIKAPETATFETLFLIIPVFVSYAISFIYLGIYWNNHHHLFHVTERINGRILWANLFLLFWLSLIPFTTSWVGEHPFESHPMVLYGVVLLMAAIAYHFLQHLIIEHHGDSFILRKAISKNYKGKMSIALYILGIIISFSSSILGMLAYVIVAIIWFIPEKRIEQNL